MPPRLNLHPVRPCAYHDEGMQRVLERWEEFSTLAPGPILLRPCDYHDEGMTRVIERTVRFCTLGVVVLVFTLESRCSSSCAQTSSDVEKLRAIQL